MSRVLVVSSIVVVLVSSGGMVMQPDAGTRAHPVSAETGQTMSLMVPDGAGGALLAWSDASEATSTIRVHKVLSTGAADAGWDKTGLALARHESNQVPVGLVADQAGGAIVVWMKVQGSRRVLAAQHVRADGTLDPRWPSNGRTLAVGDGSQTDAEAVSDGQDGVIVVWVHRGSGRSSDIRAQHVLVDGTVDPEWPADGVEVCSALGIQMRPAAVADGLGGAIVAWMDFRAGSSSDIVATRLTSGGELVGPEHGRILCAAKGSQSNPVLVGDGVGGAIVAWEDRRAGSIRSVYAHRLLASGEVDAGWPANGLRVSTDESSPIDPQLVPDGSGGAVVVWVDVQEASGMDIRAVRALQSGAVDTGWPEGGAVLCSAPGHQRSPSAISDGEGGVIVAWVDERNASEPAGLEIYGRHLLASGVVAPAWVDGDVPLCSMPSDQSAPVLVSDGKGGALASWLHDYRQINAQHVASLGPSLTIEAASLSFAAPNPARVQTSIQLALPEPARVDGKVFDVTGRLVRRLVGGNLPAGAHVLVWDLQDRLETPVRSGLYFVSVVAADRKWVRPVTVVR